MSVFRRPVVALLVSYCLGVLACRWLIFGDLTLDAPTAAAIVTVPLVQAATMAAWRRFVGGRAPR